MSFVSFSYACRLLLSRLVRWSAFFHVLRVILLCLSPFAFSFGALECFISCPSCHFTMPVAFCFLVWCALSAFFHVLRVFYYACRLLLSRLVRWSTYALSSSRLANKRRWSVFYEHKHMLSIHKLCLLTNILFIHFVYSQTCIVFSHRL